MGGGGGGDRTYPFDLVGTDTDFSLSYDATCFGESTCKSGLSVHNSHRLKAQRYLHATYLSRSICKCGLSVDDSHRLQHRATYSEGSTCESGLLVHTITDCSHRTITMLLSLVEVSV